MNHILRDRTPPFRERIVRTHTPDPGRAVDGWKKFRSCLRWEFGFTCAICLLHERDFVLPKTGAAKTGQMSIEHMEAQSIDPTKVNSYDNCLYLCRFCNGAKLGKPQSDPITGSQLLNPVEHVWSDHFKNDDDHLTPLSDYGTFTCDIYAMNDEMRVDRRQSRRELIANLKEDLEARLLDIEIICEDLTKPALTPDERQRKLSQWGRLRGEALRKVERLRAWTGIPADRNVICHCAAPTIVDPAIVAGWELPPAVDIAEPPGSPPRRFRT